MKRWIKRNIATYLIAFFGVDYDWERDEFRLNKFGLRVCTWVVNWK